jgi:hypothetical protein
VTEQTCPKAILCTLAYKQVNIVERRHQ